MGQGAGGEVLNKLEDREQAVGLVTDRKREMNETHFHGKRAERGRTGCAEKLREHVMHTRRAAAASKFLPPEFEIFVRQKLVRLR